MADGNDSSTMTIEFLRARLLSERSISRSARQRADQLAKRVAELEEQLRMVIIHRKKAERAATEVLNVLESHGIGDFCEVVDSSSDKDENGGGVLIHATEGGNMNEEDDSSNASGMQNRSEVDDGCSGSEVEVSPSQGKGLSWKGSRIGSESLERKKIIQTRQGMRMRAFIYSPDFSSKRQLGKSCRKLKRSDSTDMVGKTNGNEVGTDIQVKESDDVRAKDGSNGLLQAEQDTYNEDAKHIEGCTPVGEQNRFFDSNFYASGVDKEEDMEVALEKQAQLIDLYQAEENAQREWEEKFNENHSKMVSSEWDKNSPMADGGYVLIERTSDDNACNGNVSHDQGKCAEQTVPTVRPNAVTSDMALSGTSSSRHCSSNAQQALTAYHAFNTHDSGTNCSEHIPNGETSDLIDQRCTSSTAVESEDASQEFEFPGQAAYSRRSSTSCVQEAVGNCSDGVSDRSVNLSSNILRPVDNQFDNISSVKCSKEQSSERQIQIHHSLPRSHDSSSLEVLGSLQRAKLSLVKQLSRNLQPTSKAWESATDSRALTVQQRVPDKALNIPIGSTSLFRLPTDPLPSSYLFGSNDTGSSLAARQHHSGFEFKSNNDPYLERTLRTPLRPQDYDYRSMSGNPPLPLDTARYSYPFLDSYPTSNISSSRAHMPQMDFRNNSSQNPYMIRNIDGTDPSWRIQ